MIIFKGRVFLFNIRDILWMIKIVFNNTTFYNYIRNQKNKQIKIHTILVWI